MDDIQYEITAEDLESYRNNMLENEKSTATIEKYIRDILAFCRWNHNQSINRIQILEWKQYLVSLYACIFCQFHAGCFKQLFSF